MGLKKSGIILIAENYSDYVNKLNSINRLHKETFNAANFKGYEEAAKKIGQAFKDIPKNIPKTTFKQPTEEAMKLEEALKLIGSTGKHSLTQVSEEALKVREALRTIQKSGKFEIGKIDPIKSDILGGLTQGLDNALAKSRTFSGKMSEAFGGINKAITPLIGDVGALAGELGGMFAKFTLVAVVIKAAYDLIAFGQAAIQVAQRNETLKVSLEEIGGQVGYTSHQIDLATNILKKQGITTQAAQQSLLLMARANISWAEAQHLATIAQGSAVVAGMNSSQAFERLVRGIQKMEPELLDELGITLRRTEAYEKFAATVGKNAKELTETEKKQAILNEIYAQSSSVIGVYDAAMETTGKQQASLARLIEETQNNLGKLLLPLQANKVEMETGFWKATQKITLALSALAPLLSNILPSAFDPLKDAIADFLGMGEDFDFLDKLGEGIYNFSRLAVAGFVATRTAGQVAVKHMSDTFNDFFTGVSKGFSGDFSGSAEAFGKAIMGITDVGNDFSTAYTQNMGAVLKEYPDLMKSWSEVTEGATGDSEDLRLAQDDLAGAVEDAEEAIKKQIETLEATKDAYKSIQNIQKSYLKEISNAEKDYQKGLTEAGEKYEKEKAQMIKDQAKKLIEFDSENARKRAKMIDDFAFDQKQNARKFALDQAQSRQSFDLKQKQDSRKFHDDMLREAKRFQLSMMQVQRTQQINDRRMRADGDVLALMEAREDFANQQQINQENFNLQKQESEKGYEEQGKLATENFKLQEEQAKQSFAMQTEMQREEFQRRLADFDENIAIERQKMLEANAQALVDLEVKFEEEKVKLLEQYQERLAMAEEHRQEQMTALGNSLKEEGKITEEGMKEIQDKVAEVFGEGAGGDALIKGWADRSKDEVSNLVDEISAEIARLKGAMESGIGSSGSGSSLGGDNIPDSRPGNRNLGNPSSRPGAINRIGARHGYQGTVTGPATFDVEPGVREHVSFTPASRFGNVRVGGRVGVDVSGMSQGVSPMVEESIANTFLEEIKVAVKRLSRRHS